MKHAAVLWLVRWGPRPSCFHRIVKSSADCGTRSCSHLPNGTGLRAWCGPGRSRSASGPRAYGRAHEAIVDGDAHCHSIAAASVIAKAERDRLMDLLGGRYPRYAWASNKGYGTPDHLAALAMFGFTAHHRKSFSPVVQLELMVEVGRGR